jgi:hypothetical protein
MLLFVGYNDVDIVLTAKAVIHSREEAVGVGRQVDAYDIRALVRYNIEKSWILVCESVMILTPHSCCEKDVERGDLFPPLNLETLLNPFAVLIDHTVNDMDERLIAVE